MSLNTSGLATGMAVAVAVLMMITLVIYAYYLCNRVPPYPPRTTPAGDVQQQSLEVADLVSYPKLLFSTAKINHRDATSCSICLADYKDSDVIGLQPLCDHIFHNDCIDSWLLLRPTCPLCRT